jgi:hypothetical protein
MAVTNYTIFQVIDAPDGYEVWRGLGIGVGSSPAGAARDFFSGVGEKEQAKDGEHYIAVPTRNIHSLPATVEVTTQLKFG